MTDALHNFNSQIIPDFYFTYLGNSFNQIKFYLTS